MSVGAALPRAPSGRERLRDSYWVAWTFTIVLNWVAFLWIGYRARNRRWSLWGCLYALPFLASLALAEEGALVDVMGVLALVLGCVSIVHAFKVRAVYIEQRRALLGLPPVEASSVVAPGPTRSPAERVGHAVGAIALVALYVGVGLAIGAIVMVATWIADPCGPECVSASGSERADATEAVAVVGGLAYLGLIVPIVWMWNTWRVWLVVLLGGLGVGTLTLLAMWLAVQATSAPAFCNC